MVDIFSKLNLRHVINASGTETPFGSAPARPEVVAAVAEIIPYSVLMRDLQSAANESIARALGSEAGCVIGCTAGSISVAVAACMAGRDLGRVEQLPDTEGMKCEVVMQKGHEITYGQNVSQNIRLAGASVVEIGVATQCGEYQLRHAINKNTAAAMYVVSPLTSQKRLIDLETFCSVCHELDVPVIVDAASVADPRPYIQAGGDLVLFSAHKKFAGVTAGIIAGKLELVQACIYQEHGIGRAMKVGKEGVIGAIAALDAWLADDHATLRTAQKSRAARAVSRLRELKGAQATIEGSQVRLYLDPKASPVSAYTLSRRLFNQDPCVIVWSQFANDGILMLSLNMLSDKDADFVCDQIIEICSTRNQKNLPAQNIADMMNRELDNWPRMQRRSMDG
jgi:L-seryl-tRNA(Ser) seleniumtransferase